MPAGPPPPGPPFASIDAAVAWQRWVCTVSGQECERTLELSDPAAPDWLRAFAGRTDDCLLALVFKGEEVFGLLVREHPPGFFVPRLFGRAGAALVQADLDLARRVRQMPVLQGDDEPVFAPAGTAAAGDGRRRGGTPRGCAHPPPRPSEQRGADAARGASAVFGPLPAGPGFSSRADARQWQLRAFERQGRVVICCLPAAEAGCAPRAGGAGPDAAIIAALRRAGGEAYQVNFADGSEQELLVLRRGDGRFQTLPLTPENRALLAGGPTAVRRAPVRASEGSPDGGMPSLPELGDALAADSDALVARFDALLPAAGAGRAGDTRTTLIARTLADLDALRDDLARHVPG